MNTGQCVFAPLAEDGVDAMPDGNGKVRIRTPKEFFDLDDSYQYTGTVRNTCTKINKYIKYDQD